MRITFLRHTQVSSAYLGKYNGHIDIPLSKQGKEDAKKLASSLQKENFDLIYCSDLLRTRETLQALQLQAKTVFTHNLREKSWGRHEGKSYDEICKSEKIIYQNFMQWINALDGESIECFQKRVTEYFYNTILKQNTKNVLILTHSGVIKTLLGFHYNYSLEESFSLQVEYGTTITLEL